MKYHKKSFEEIHQTKLVLVRLNAYYAGKQDVVDRFRPTYFRGCGRVDRKQSVLYIFKKFYDRGYKELPTLSQDDPVY